MNKLVIFDWMGTLYERNKGPFPESRQVLHELGRKGYSLALISLSKDQTGRRREIDRSGLANSFDIIIIDKEKTEVQYMGCIKRACSNPAHTVIVDDRTVRGIQIGNKLGCKTYWIQNGEYAHELPNAVTGHPTRTIKSVSELPHYL